MAFSGSRGSRRGSRRGSNAAASRAARSLVWLAAGWAVVAVLCCQMPPRWWWPTAFGAMTLPVALAFNAALLGWLAVGRRGLAVWPLAVLVLGWGYMQRGFAVHVPAPAEPPQYLASRSPTVGATADSATDALRVLSYNVRIFNFYQSLASPGYTTSKAQIDWLNEHPADILCLQEYYNQVKANPKYPFFQTRRALGKKRHPFVSVAYPFRGQEFGLAIFSRYPIIRRGVISFGRLTQNHAQWADIRRPARDGRPADTVRVYNVHFQSMSLDENAIVATTRRRQWLDAAGLGLLRRFRDGAVRRSRQADTVANHARAARLPIIVCGDFNDVPYSYTYSVFNNFLVNAQQAAGAGVGATYHGRLPLLRIDNQFSAPSRLTPAWVRVHDDVRYSDHYPVDVVYRVERRGAEE